MQKTRGHEMEAVAQGFRVSSEMHSGTAKDGHRDRCTCVDGFC